MIVVYDTNTKRITILHNYLRQNLHWVQNSVFEGEVRLSQMVKVKEKIKKIIKDEDSVIIYTFNNKKQMRRIIIGKERNKIKNIL